MKVAQTKDIRGNATVEMISIYDGDILVATIEKVADARASITEPGRARPDAIKIRRKVQTSESEKK
jgi:hypothetical protein